MNPLIYILAPMLLLYSATSYGATMRCANGIISTGDLSHVVRDTCGEPVSRKKENPSINEYSRIVQGAALVEYWVYKNGGMTYTLRFIDDRLVQISGSR